MLTAALLLTPPHSEGISTASLETIYASVFKQLEVDPSEYTVIMTEPQMCSEKDRAKIAEIMFETFNVPALCIKPQPILAMYSYGATTGVVVDIGERLDIFPMDSGYLFEKGVSKLRYGGHVITEQMQRMMTEDGHRFFSPVESYIARCARLLGERSRFVPHRTGVDVLGDAPPPWRGEGGGGERGAWIHKYTSSSIFLETAVSACSVAALH